MYIKNRKLIFQAEPWMRLYQQSVEGDNQDVGAGYHLNMGAYSMIYAETSDDKVILERQYKHGVKELTLVFPEGGIEPDEKPLDAAKRELLEETGYISYDWLAIGQFVLHEEYNCGLCYMFNAKGAIKVSEPKSGDLEDMEILLMQPEDVFKAVISGEIKSLGTVAMASMAANSKIWTSR